MRCVELAQAQPKKVEGSTKEWDVEKRVQELLTGGKPSHREKWKAVLQAYSARAGVLPDNQRRFLQHVNETLAPERLP